MIELNEPPALRQSVFEDMACAHMYWAKHKKRIPESSRPDAARGVEDHEVLATYLTHLMRNNLRKDLRFLDALMMGVSEDAQEALVRFRDDHDFDPEKIAGVEIEIALDENFKPVDPGTVGAYAAAKQCGTSIAYLGKLDLVILQSQAEAEIVDWKTYYQIIDPKHFQSKFYPLLLFCWNPSLERVKFVLEFVRYGASRTVEYTRSDIPMLKAIAQHARKRQRQLHEALSIDGAQPQASPGRHCMWCPLVLSGCPLANQNPYITRSPAEQLKYVIWLREADKQNTELLKQWVLQNGPVECHDDNGVEYVAGFSELRKQQYPCTATSRILKQWLRTHPNDRTITEQLTMSGLSSFLKARKRQSLAKRLASIARTTVTTRFDIDRKSGDQPRLDHAA